MKTEFKLLVDLPEDDTFFTTIQDYLGGGIPVWNLNAHTIRIPGLSQQAIAVVTNTRSLIHALSLPERSIQGIIAPYETSGNQFHKGCAPSQNLIPLLQSRIIRPEILLQIPGQPLRDNTPAILADFVKRYIDLCLFDISELKKKILDHGLQIELQKVGYAFKKPREEGYSPYGYLSKSPTFEEENQEQIPLLQISIWRTKHKDRQHFLLGPKNKTYTYSASGEFEEVNIDDVIQKLNSISNPSSDENSSDVSE